MKCLYKMVSKVQNVQTFILTGYSISYLIKIALYKITPTVIFFYLLAENLVRFCETNSCGDQGFCVANSEEQFCVCNKGFGFKDGICQSSKIIVTSDRLFVLYKTLFKLNT